MFFGNIHGIFMEYLWNLYGIFMEYEYILWNIYGIWVEYEWNINGIWVLIDIVTADHLVTGRDPTDGGKSSPAAGEESRPGLMKTVSEIWRRNSSLMVNIAWHLLGILYFSSIVPKECLLKNWWNTDVMCHVPASTSYPLRLLLYQPIKQWQQELRLAMALVQYFISVLDHVIPHKISSDHWRSTPRPHFIPSMGRDPQPWPHWGTGKRKGTREARMPTKVLWMRRQRVLSLGL